MKINKSTLSNTLYILLVFIIISFLVSGITYKFLLPLLELNKKNIIFSYSGWVFETISLTLYSLIIYVFSCRKKLTIIILLLSYFLFISANFIKIYYLNQPIYPKDFLLIGDLVRTWGVFRQFLPYILAVVVLFVLPVVIFKKREQLSIQDYSVRNTMLILLSVTCVIIYFFNSDIRKLLISHGIYHKKNVNLIKRGLRYGFLTNFLQASFFIGKPNVPNKYGRIEIDNLVEKYGLSVYTQPLNENPDNVILLLAESFTDPISHNWKFTIDPIPNYRKFSKTIHHGIVLSPVYGGRSINAEFELLTGLTNRFTPIESTPFQEFLDKPIQSLPRSFKENGYITTAIQMINFKGFGYEKIYEYLGVDNKLNLSNQLPGIESDPSKRSTSSKSISKAIIEITNNQNKSFIFAFPNSSHSPWILSNYKDTKLLINDEMLSEYQSSTISAYANAINHVDLLIGYLMEYFENSEEKTLLIVVGDHQPGISFYNQRLKYNPDYDEYTNETLKKYSVSLGIWSNYNLKIDNKIKLSMNLLPSLIAEISGIKTKGILKFNNELRKRFDYISNIYKISDGEFYRNLPAKYLELVRDYEMLQYDILFGKNYLMNY